MDEMTRTLQGKLDLSGAQTTRLVGQLREHFRDCWVDGYESLIPAMSNHPKDRHVVAAAVRTGAQTIVTFNRRDFPAESLAPWNIEAQSPDVFLVHQFHLNQTIMLTKIQEQAKHRDGIERLLAIHSKTVPVLQTCTRRASLITSLGSTAQYVTTSFR